MRPRIAFLEDRVLKMEEDLDINITLKKMNASSSSKRKKALTSLDASFFNGGR